MELIEECKDERNNWAAYWLSKKPGICEVGLKVIVDFNRKNAELIIEEGIKGKQHKNMLISFDEFKTLQTIIEERK